MMLLDPKAVEAEVLELSQRLQLALVEEIAKEHANREIAFAVFDSILNDLRCQYNSFLFGVFAKRWECKIKFMFLVQQRLEPELSLTFVDTLDSFGHLNILDWAHMRLEVAAIYESLGESEKCNELRSLVREKTRELELRTHEFRALV